MDDLRPICSGWYVSTRLRTGSRPPVLTPETWQSLREYSAPSLVRYTVTEKDAAGTLEKTLV